MTYLDSRDSLGNLTHSWQRLTERRLTWQYGHERAADIINGRDPATQEDIRKWRELGR